MIQKLNAEGRLEKKEAKKGSFFDKVSLLPLATFVHILVGWIAIVVSNFSSEI